MTVLSAQSLEREIRRGLIWPYSIERQVLRGRTYGIGPCSYDVCIDKGALLWPGRFLLRATIERFNVPDDLVGHIQDKSTNIRHGFVVGNTKIDPGFKGTVTLEIKSWCQLRWVWIHPGTPIAQIQFTRLDKATDRPYSGKYQNAKPGATPALFEGSR